MSTPQTYAPKEILTALQKKLLAIELEGEGLAKDKEHIKFVVEHIEFVTKKKFVTIQILEECLKEYTEIFDKGFVETKTRVVSPRTEPPRIAEFLVSWCTKKGYREALRDNLDEVFQRDLSNGITVARARLRYWGGALNSITPQLLAAAKRIGIIGLIADYARRLLN